MMKLVPALCRFRIFVSLALTLSVCVPAAAADFPFDQQLMLDVAPMGKVRRVPSVTISEDGTARLELWCKTASAQVSLDATAIQIVPAPLPDALPQYMSDGQCSPERMAADADLVAALSQVTTWQKAGGVVTLGGPSVLRFRPSDH
jgi:heat shock protein HslJ